MYKQTQNCITRHQVHKLNIGNLKVALNIYGPNNMQIIDYFIKCHFFVVLSNRSGVEEVMLMNDNHFYRHIIMKRKDLKTKIAQENVGLQDVCVYVWAYAYMSVCMNVYAERVKNKNTAYERQN